jgi:4-amino-4-deoxy-L-arabinose transferase-like glycosyltransferase
MTRLRAALFAAVAALGAIALRVPFLRLGLSPDEGYQSLVARQWLSGRLLYSDLAFVRPPLLAMPYALARVVTGHEGDVTLRLFAAGWSALTVAVIAYFLLRRSRLLPALAGIALALAWSASIALQNEANAETWLLLPWTAGALLFLHVTLSPSSRRTVMLSMLAGALVGASALFKQPGVVGLALPLAALAIGGRSRSEWLREAVAFVGGALEVLLLSAVVCAASGDGVAYLFRAWVGMSAYVSAERSRTADVMLGAAWVRAALAYFVPAACVAVAGVLAWRQPRSAPAGRAGAYVRFALVWLAISLVGVSLSGYYFRHYFIQTVPALALLAAGALDAALEGSGWRRATVAALVGAAVLSAAIGWIPAEKDMARLRSDRGVAVRIAKRIDADTKPGDRVIVWGVHLAAGAYMEREPASRMSWFWISGFDPPGTVRFLGREFPSKGTLALEDLRPDNVDAIAITSPLTGLDPRDNEDPRIAARLVEMTRSGYREVESGRSHAGVWGVYVRER